MKLIQIDINHKHQIINSDSILYMMERKRNENGTIDYFVYTDVDCSTPMSVNEEMYRHIASCLGNSFLNVNIFDNWDGKPQAGIINLNRVSDFGILPLRPETPCLFRFNNNHTTVKVSREVWEALSEKALQKTGLIEGAMVDDATTDRLINAMSLTSSADKLTE